ncbi:MAG: hypothetical protein ABJQ70_10625 [Roseobacter sp.]
MTISNFIFASAAKVRFPPNLLEELRLNGSADRDRDRDRDRFGLAAAIGTQAASRSKAPHSRQ